ncbi:PleD family two-component system response regulator [Ehrlichia canis]|uniref:Response regulator receiver modulated diguanylate cyclase n=1 Tax=Ehrlichia canis (strain Jake) TaxID=269484 RepID=A0ACA6AVG6_EHRCJ|nr:PleD family two-component system response regulator [Ehrlichia canis]AAZ68348.1 response regulator receiver modulated diguanylate cyclase [Ehrlichia canis str. Jake]AUO54893.1 PleD family two-component system response regulator [Ehrlichia canis]UKC53139.1 PleD family two-component system response regulator [Ehrlichia canis]UKC54076.1 PleD family two-component system response regulator [Ehrlichia canis]UKC55012.1 PleD family two-component system response regulator [Ehrlichia canis]
MTAKVLIVDDLPANIKLLQAKLMSEYYNVLTATNGMDAIKIAEEKHPDIILLDVMMPEMDGYETCKRLKSNPATTYIPIVMVTALDNTSDNRVSGLSYGADDFLTKPINDTALFARIRSLTRFKMVIDELRLRGKTNADMSVLNNNMMDYANKIDNASILIVDEDVIRSEHINNILQKSFQQTVVSHDIDQALNLSNIQNYDLIITDLEFSGDGLRLCSQLRNKIETRYTPILVLLDENEDPKLLSKAFDIGIHDYITTPVDSNELIARVNVQVKRKRYQDALRINVDTSMTMAITDPLTGCYNRRYFDMHFHNIINESLQKEKNLSLMILDIDHFKEVNDTFGHTVGDELLQQFKKRVSDNIRITDLLARFGGEEFVVILPDTTISTAEQIARRILTVIKDTPFKTSIGDINKTVSIGVVEVQKSDVDNIKQLIDRADKCLYEAKNTGRNKVVIYLQ